MHDEDLVQKMQNLLKRSDENYGTRPPVPKNICSCTNGEKMGPEDESDICWLIVYAQLDCQDWLGALESLVRVYTDIASGRWPIFFWVEALYLKAVVDFGLGQQNECKGTLCMYDTIAHMQDRQRRNVSMLQLWANNTTPEDFDELLEQDGRPNVTEMEALWDSDTFSETSYICDRIGEVMGKGTNVPLAGVFELTEEQLASEFGFVPDFIKQGIDFMNAPGWPHGVIVRFRNTRHGGKQRNEEHDEDV